MLSEQENEKEEKQRRVEFNFPILILRTQAFGCIFDKLGALKSTRVLSWLSLIIVPVVAAAGLYLLANSLIALLWAPAVREISRSLGPGGYLLLPGINPVLPIFYGWIAIICAITVHEGAHGIIARSLGLKVKSSGLLFLLFIPIGAFVDVDEKQIAKARPKNALRVMAGGVGGNIIVAIVCIISVIIIVNGLTPAVDGVYINQVSDGLPAKQAGLQTGDVFISINNTQINSQQALQTFLNGTTPGDSVSITVARGEGWQSYFSTSLELAESEGRAFIGVTTFDLMTNERLRVYQTLDLNRLSVYLVPPALAPGLVPFSDASAPFYTHPIGPSWIVLANLFFWLWFINVNIAVFNALPIYPLDGGRMFNILIKRILGERASEKTVQRITLAVTAVLAAVILLIVVIPFIL